MEQLNAELVHENIFPLQRKWIQNNQLPGYESSEFGYESPGYETTVGANLLGTKRLWVRISWVRNDRGCESTGKHMYIITYSLSNKQ